MDSDSTCSSSKNDTIQDAFYNDQVRYQRKGYGLIMAILIFAGYFTLFPLILKAIWPYVLQIQNVKMFQAVVEFFFPLVLLSIGNFIMYVIYVIKLPFFERYRINTKPWDWEIDGAKWRQTLRKALKQIAINQFVFLAPIVYIDIVILDSLKARMDLESFPGMFEVLVQILFMMLVEDMTFYWSHRTLHTPFFYKRIHKIHHEFSNSVSIAAVYAHPLEYILGNALPAALGIKILGSRCHFATIIIWFVIRALETIDGHCGYEFSWSPYRLLPFSSSSEYHNFHHSNNIGTFSSFFTFWDTLMGTNKQYFQYKAKKEREDKLNQLRQEHKQNKLIKSE